MMAPLALAALAAAIVAAATASPASPVVPEIKFADLNSAVESGNLGAVKDAGGKVGAFVVADVPTAGYTDAVVDLVRHFNTFHSTLQNYF